MIVDVDSLRSLDAISQITLSRSLRWVRLALMCYSDTSGVDSGECAELF